MCQCEVPGCLPHQCPNEALSGTAVDRMVAMGARIANLCHKATALCGAIDANDGFAVHEIKEQLAAMAERYGGQGTEGGER